MKTFLHLLVLLGAATCSLLKAEELQVTFTPPPSTNAGARWRIDGGAWLASGAKASNLAADTPYSIEYSPVKGAVAPNAETVVLSDKQSLQLYRTYVSQAALTLRLDPPEARWRIDGREWLAAGTTVKDLDFDTPHRIEYTSLAGFVAPDAETVVLARGQSLPLYRAYAPLAAVAAVADPSAQLYVTLYPDLGWWRVDGGPWQFSESGAGDLAPDIPHAIEYSPLDGFVTPAPETVSLARGQALQHSCAYRPLAQLYVTTYPSHGRWRVDGGPWQNSESGALDLAFASPHTIEYAPVEGFIAPAPETVKLGSAQVREHSRAYVAIAPHRLRFFVTTDLAGGMPLAELSVRLSQYADHLAQVFARESRHRLAFDPLHDITLCTADPFSGSFNGTLPETRFEVWIHARLTDNPAIGTYGGDTGLDSSGAGGARDLKWDQIYDPASLADGSPALGQYWRQLDGIMHQLEHMFGAGLGEYYSLGGLQDASGVAPVLPDTESVNSIAPDSFWNSRMEYWTDPLTVGAYRNPRLGSPSALDELLELVSFAPVTEAILNGSYRNPGRRAPSLPDLSAVVVRVVDARSGQPVPGATLRVWNRQDPEPPHGTYEESVTATDAPGVFNFRWTGAPVPLNDYENAKLLKAFAPGYDPVAQWVTVYDAQKVRVVEGRKTFEVTLALAPK